MNELVKYEIHYKKNSKSENEINFWGQMEIEK